MNGKERQTNAKQMLGAGPFPSRDARGAAGLNPLSWGLWGQQQSAPCPR